MKRAAIKAMAMSAVIFAGLVFAGAGCSSADKVSGGEEFEGWRLINGVDYFYMRVPGSASKIAKDSGEMSRMKATCIESTRLQANDLIIRKITGEIVQAVSGTADAESTGVVIQSMRSGIIKGVELKECAKRASKWAQCECIHYVRGQGLKDQFQLEVKKTMKKEGV